jgi:hypothetical protein
LSLFFFESIRQIAIAMGIRWGHIFTTTLLALVACSCSRELRLSGQKDSAVFGGRAVDANDEIAKSVVAIKNHDAEVHLC